MRLYAAEGTLILGRQRRDGTRRVLALRLVDWSHVADSLRLQGVPVRVGDDDKLYVRLDDAYQRVFPFLEDSFPGEVSPAHRFRKRSRRPANGRPE